MSKARKLAGKDLTVFQLGALTHREIAKKAKRVPSFAGFLDPEIFKRSLGWFQTKKKRGYTEEQASEFMEGFTAAHELPFEEHRRGRTRKE